MPAPRYIGEASAFKFSHGGNIKNWTPVDGYTSTSCGLLTDFHFFVGSEKAERDWGLYILDYTHTAVVVPDTFWDDPLSSASSAAFGGWANCPGYGKQSCIEAEITPPYELEGNPWFPSSGGSPLIGKRVCVHGPWVQERVHDYKPEIHPAELIWWGEGGPRNDQVQHFIQQLDKSHRFDESANFTDSGYVRPWAQGPLNHDVGTPVQIEYESGKPKNPTELVVESLASKGTLSQADSVDPGNVSHSLVVDGQEIVRVTEAVTDANQFGIWFEGVCRAGDWVRSTVRVRTGIAGVYDYNVFRVSMKPIADPYTAPKHLELTAPMAMIERIEGSSRRETLFGQSTIVSDFTVPTKIVKNLAGLRMRLMNDNREVIREVQTRQVGNYLQFTAPIENVTEVHLVDVLDRQVLAWAPVGGTVLNLLAAESAPGQLAKFNASGQEVKALGRSLGTPGELRSANDLVAVGSWILRAEPNYSGLKQGQRAPEEESALSEVLNEALFKGSKHRLDEMFGKGKRISIVWSVEALDVLKGTKINVKVGTGSKGDTVAANLMTSKLASDTLKLNFPSTRLVRAKIVATATDPHGRTAATQWVVWNLGIAPQAADQMLHKLLTARHFLPSVVAENWDLPKVPINKLRFVTDDGKSVTEGDGGSRKVRTVKAALQHESRKGIVTVDDLWPIVRTIGVIPMTSVDGVLRR